MDCNKVFEYSCSSNVQIDHKSGSKAKNFKFSEEQIPIVHAWKIMGKQVDIKVHLYKLTLKYFCWHFVHLKCFCEAHNLPTLSYVNSQSGLINNAYL
jgi:hypothetical protein